MRRIQNGQEHGCRSRIGVAAFGTLLTVAVALAGIGLSPEPVFASATPTPTLPPTATPTLPLMLGTAFTYQGQLLQGGTPVTGPCDLQFNLFDTTGVPFGTTQTLLDVPVNNGLFTVQLDFGAGAFTGLTRLLDIAARCPAGSGSFVELSPRQQLTAAPYALYAPAAGSAASAAGVSCTGCITGSNLAGGTIQASNLAFAPVTAVGASPPLVSSGGQTPDISLTGTVAVANGGTGASIPSSARANLGTAASGANSDITSLSGITGNIALPNSTNASVGVISKGGSQFIHDFGGGTFIGSAAGNFSMTGSNNTGVGAHTLSNNTTGIQNTAVGEGALPTNTSGGNNTAVGQDTLHSNQTGDINTAVGTGALQRLTSGSGNIAIGAGSTGTLGFLTTGNDNIAIGGFAGGNFTGAESNNVDIGNFGVAGESNTIRIGNGQTATFIAGISATISGGTQVLVDSAGQLGTTPSSARFKDDIQDMGDSTDGLMQLRPVRFRYKKDIDPSGLQQYGLVAEEVAKVYPDLVVYDEQGRPRSVRYHFVNAMLLNEVQKQARQIAALKEETAALTARLEALERNGTQRAADRGPSGTAATASAF